MKKKTNRAIFGDVVYKEAVLEGTIEIRQIDDYPVFKGLFIDDNGEIVFQSPFLGSKAAAIDCMNRKYEEKFGAKGN